MPTLTLLEKVYGSFSSETFEPVFSSLCQGLKVELKVVGKTSRGWIQVKVSGEDETVASHYIGKEVGLAPVSIDKLKRFSTVHGRVISSKESENQLLVDVGVFSPRIYDATVSLQNLQSQLADGKNLSIQRVIELFCLYENLPLEVKIVGNVDARRKHVEAELSETQHSQIMRWIRSSLDRLVVLGASFSDVEHAVRASKHARDVIKVESLGLLEHAVVCKLGTHAVGLTPKLGPLLSTAKLASFSPRKIRREFSGPGRT
jgi:hypothetical protein